MLIYPRDAFLCAQQIFVIVQVVSLSEGCGPKCLGMNGKLQMFVIVLVVNLSEGCYFGGVVVQWMS